MIAFSVYTTVMPTTSNVPFSAADLCTCTDREFIADCAQVPLSAVGQMSNCRRFQFTREILTDEELQAAVSRLVRIFGRNGKKVYHVRSRANVNRPPAGGFGLWQTYVVR